MREGRSLMSYNEGLNALFSGIVKSDLDCRLLNYYTIKCFPADKIYNYILSFEVQFKFDTKNIKVYY
jgi:hypothetical protein